MRKEYISPRISTIKLNASDSIAADSGTQPSVIKGGYWFIVLGDNCVTYLNNFLSKPYDGRSFMANTIQAWAASNGFDASVCGGEQPSPW